MTKLKALLRDERGASMVEYSLLIGLITVAAVTAMGLVSEKIVGAWEALEAAFPDAPGA